MLVVARPGAGGVPTGGAALARGGALLRVLFHRQPVSLARTDSNETTLFYSNLVGVVALMPVVPIVWTTPTDPLVIALMVASGAMGSFGHYLLIAAHRLAPAAVLAPFIYSEIVQVIILGYLVFGDVPNRWTLVGCAIVVGSGLYILYRERRVRGEYDRYLARRRSKIARCFGAYLQANLRTGRLPLLSSPALVRGSVMAKKPARASDGSRPGINDDIGEEMRLTMYRMQVEIREAEQRAFDLFLQNLVKGTSHLSLGQEAVATGFAAAMKPGDLSFCTYRGHAHTLARGVPIDKVLGELMQRDNGLMRGKGGSMHLTSAEHGVMGSYAIIGAHLPIACGAALRAQYKGDKRRVGLLLRRRHHQYRRLPRGA